MCPGNGDFRRDEESILPYFKVVCQLLNFSFCFWSRFQSTSLREYHCPVIFSRSYNSGSEAYLSKTHCLKYLETTFQKPRFLLLIPILRNYLVRWYVLKAVYTGGNGYLWNLNPFGDTGVLSTASGRSILKAVAITHHSKSMGVRDWTQGVGQWQASVEQSYTHLSYYYQLLMGSSLKGRNRFTWVPWAMETKKV